MAARSGDLEPILLICRFLCGHPRLFRSVRDPGRVAAGLFMLVGISARSFAPVAPSVAPGRAG